MSARTRRGARGAARLSASASARQAKPCCHDVPSPPAALPRHLGPPWGRLTELQRGWWAIGLAGTFVATLGFQALPPARRLDAIEAANARQDSALTAQSVAQRVALDTIRRQLGQLLAGQCAKERDGMARVLYGCGER